MSNKLTIDQNTFFLKELQNQNIQLNVKPKLKCKIEENINQNLFFIIMKFI